MPGLGLLVLMLLPLFASAALLLAAPAQFRRASSLRSLWLVPLAVIVTVLGMSLQSGTDLDNAAINRSVAVAVLIACVGFAWANRAQASRLVRIGVLLVAGGGAANAFASLYYGFMPVLASSASWLGPDLAVGSSPDPQYVATDTSQVVALLFGDVLPVRGPDVVISLGDILLVPGCAVLLAAFLAPAFLYIPAHLATGRR
jgi:hypothetical protein